MSWFKATRNHVHHRLLDLGFSHYQSVVVIYSFQAVLVTCGVLLRYASDWAVVMVYVGAIAALFALLAAAERSGWRVLPKAWPQLESLRAWTGRLRASDQVRNTFTWGIAATVSALLLFAVVRSGAVPRDFGVTAALAALLTLVAVVWPSRWQGLALRITIYVTAVFATYLLTAQPDVVGAGLLRGFGVAIIALAIMLGLFVRFVSDRRFGATPTDYLIVFALIAMFVFGAMAGRGILANASLSFISFSIVLFYGCEVVIGHLQRWRPVLGGVSLVALFMVAWRGLVTGL
jgi:UDP-GlcNAc:undecaprenyl-phosphate GlcNAc-1-phosphate transferase